MMSSKMFLVTIFGLALLVTITAPPLLRPLLFHVTPPLPTVTPAATASPTPTVDPFATVPTVTPRAQLDVQIRQLPAPAWGDIPPTFTPTPDVAVSTE